jgi:hypothetical protein
MKCNIKTYIIHCKRLTDRFDLMNKQLNENSFTDVVWYTDNDVPDIKDLTGIYEGVRPEIFTEKVTVGGWNPVHHLPRLLNPAEVSVTIKFGKVFEMIAKGDDPYVFIFEDDAYIPPNFMETVSSYLNQTPDDWDAIYMGNGANLHAPNIQEGKVAYKVNHPATRCVDSILMKKEAASKLAKDYFPFDLCSDWEIGYQQARHNLNVYWWEPSICTQGSETGKFKTTLR